MPPQPSRAPHHGAAPDRRLLSGPADVVAAVPYLLGHQPHHSLVALSLRRGGDVGLVARIDLPPPGTRGPDLEEVAREGAGRLVHTLALDGAERVVLTVHEAAEPPEPMGPGAAELVGATLLAALAAGIDVPGVTRVGGTRWRCLAPCPPACAGCPEEGHELAEARTRPAALGFVLDGRSPAQDRRALEPAAPPASRADRRAAAQAATRWRRGHAGAPDLARRRAVLEEWVGAVADHRAGGALPRPSACGRLGAAWSDDRRLRDACMLAVLPGAGLVPEAVLTGAPVDLVPLLSDRRCAGALVGVAPLLRTLAATVPGPSRGAVLAVHAWLAWASGAGAAAADLAARALAADAGQRLAELVSGLLERAVAPDWAAPASGGDRGGGPVRAPRGQAVAP